MTPAEVFDMARLAIETLLYVAGPIMLIALAVGLIIALFQALTSIQEITLTFVPKILLVFVSLVFLLPYMANQMAQMSETIFNEIADNQQQIPQ